MYGQYLVILRCFFRYAFDFFDSIRSRASRAYPYTYRFGSVSDLANEFVADFDLLPFLLSISSTKNQYSSVLHPKSSHNWISSGNRSLLLVMPLKDSRSPPTLLICLAILPQNKQQVHILW